MKNINWEKVNAEGILLTNPKNIRHFTNVQVSTGFVVVTKETTKLIVDSRYFEVANKIFKGEVVLFKSIETVKEIVSGFKNLAIEADFVTVQMQGVIEKMNPNLVNINGAELRIVKDEEDLTSLREAVKITKQVMEEASKELKPGKTEKEIERFVINKLYEYGSEELDYWPIIISGPNSSMPHGKAGNRVLEQGDTVMFDFAAVINGFTADITRNYAVGEIIDEELIKIYDIVKRSQEAGIKVVRPGIKASEIDKACRDLIQEEGYGEFFNHSTGHGLGRDVHELPVVSPKSEDILQPGHVITVEPAIYIPGKGGIRIEDDILVTKDGYEIL